MKQSPSIEIASAVTEDGGMATLGDGRTQWYMPEDLRRFRRITSEGNTSMAIAAQTFRAMRLAGYPLFAGRHNIVVGQIPDGLELPTGHEAAPDLAHAIGAASENGSSKVFLVGDSEFYRASFRRVSRLHLTVVQGRHDTSERFPSYADGFGLVHEEPLYTEATGISYIFRQYEKVKS